MKHYKTIIHLQNSSKSVTLHVPAVLFKVWPAVKVVGLVGLVLLVVQICSTTIYDGLLKYVLHERSSLGKELSQIESTIDYLTGTSAEFLRDEQRLHYKYGLPLPDVESRELGTGGYVAPDSVLLRKSSPVFGKMVSLKQNARRVQAKLEKNAESFNTLRDYMEQTQNKWRYIPSISPTTGHYISAFGPRIHPVTGEVGKMHQGIDITNDRWTPIFAPADGVVETARFSDSFGNFVELNHGNGIKTRLGHMQLYVVNPGQFVRRYQILGYMGNTGRSVGSHLHYEVWVGGNPVNPLAYILPSDHSVD